MAGETGRGYLPRASDGLDTEEWLAELHRFAVLGEDFDDRA
jgi:hypothetical protein